MIQTDQLLDTLRNLHLAQRADAAIGCRVAASRYPHVLSLYRSGMHPMMAARSIEGILRTHDQYIYIVIT